MRLSDLAKQIVDTMKKHGDLEVFDANYFSVSGINVVEKEPDQFEPSWNMPDVFAQVNSYK